MSEHNENHPPSEAGEWVAWAHNYAAQMQHGDTGPEELLVTFGEVRRSAQVAAAAEEWLLLAAREAGGRLQDLAEVIAGHPLRDQRRTYVTGPSDRIKRLQRDYGDAAGRLEALIRRHGDPDADEAGPPGEPPQDR